MRDRVVDAGRGTFDPDLDLEHRRPDAAIEPIVQYQRLVANPFLAALGWLAAFGLIREALRRTNLPLFFTSIALFFLSFLLLQFHCLDCGATRWLPGYQRHACPAVVARQANAARRRFRGPRLRTQLVLWFVLVAVVFVLGMLVIARRR
jgi:hypothetical protein